jgi:hypothetical protein
MARQQHKQKRKENEPEISVRQLQKEILQYKPLPHKDSKNLNDK